MAIYNEKHEEIPDNTPVAMPVGHERPESLESMIARMIRTTNAIAAKTGAFDTDEEADDFETGEPEPVSAYQMTDMEEEAVAYGRSTRASKPAENAKTEPQAQPSMQPIEKAQETTVSAATQTVKT